MKTLIFLTFISFDNDDQYIFPKCYIKLIYEHHQIQIIFDVINKWFLLGTDTAFQLQIQNVINPSLYK